MNNFNNSHGSNDLKEISGSNCTRGKSGTAAPGHKEAKNPPTPLQGLLRSFLALYLLFVLLALLIGYACS